MSNLSKSRRDYTTRQNRPLHRAGRTGWHQRPRQNAGRLVDGRRGAIRNPIAEVMQGRQHAEERGRPRGRRRRGRPSILPWDDLPACAGRNRFGSVQVVSQAQAGIDTTLPRCLLLIHTESSGGGDARAVGRFDLPAAGSRDVSSNRALESRLWEQPGVVAVTGPRARHAASRCLCWRSALPRSRRPRRRGAGAPPRIINT